LKYIKKNLLLILCGCKVSSLTLREEHRFRLLENRVLKRILGPEREEAAGG
jgi:hypothetical protein